MLEETELSKRKELLDLSNQLEASAGIQKAVQSRLDNLKKSINQQSEENIVKNTQIITLVDNIQNDYQILNEINQKKFDNSNYSEDNAVDDMHELIKCMENKLKHVYAEKREMK